MATIQTLKEMHHTPLAALMPIFLTGHAVHHDQRTISDTESSSHFRGEVNVAGGVNEIDQKAIAIDALLDEGGVCVAQLVEEGDGAAEGREVEY